MQMRLWAAGIALERAPASCMQLEVREMGNFATTQQTQKCGNWQATGQASHSEQEPRNAPHEPFQDAQLAHRAWHATAAALPPARGRSIISSFAAGDVEAQVQLRHLEQHAAIVHVHRVAAATHVAAASQTAWRKGAVRASTIQHISVQGALLRVHVVELSAAVMLRDHE